MQYALKPALLAAFGVALAATAASAQSTSRGAEVIAADKGRITGEIVVDFGSRKLSGATGVDIYTISNIKAGGLDGA